MPSCLLDVFITLAPAEWTYNLHDSMLYVKNKEELSAMQSVLTLHMHNSMTALLKAHLLKPGRADSLKPCHIKKMRNWCLRFEFQDRGTIHVHMILCADLF